MHSTAWLSASAALPDFGDDDECDDGGEVGISVYETAIC